MRPCRLLVADGILFILCLVTSWHAAIEMTILHLKVNGQCLLFGQIFEKKRIFISGSTSLCWLFMCAEYILGAFGIYFARKCCQEPGRNWIIQSSTWALCCVCSSLVMSILFSAGFYSICNSLDYAPVCNEETIWNLEFKYFTPKYFDANHFYSQFERIMVSIWLNTLCWLFACIANSRKQKI